VRPGCLAILLHAHLPFVRHPEHERFLEENWLFEAVVESYLPLLEVLEGWQRDHLAVRLTVSLSPTLCAMLQDGLLQERCRKHLEGLIDLAKKEVLRTHLDPACHELARFYRDRFVKLRAQYQGYGCNLVRAFAGLQEAGVVEIITCAATHAVLPLLLPHPGSVRAQIMVARDYHRACFGRDPAGIWLPECAYTPGLERFLAEADLRWFVLDTHGLLHARPRPRFGVFAPVLTPSGVAAFGRDPASARQVWSRHEGYPGEASYRDFYRDIGFDLDWHYVRPHLPATEARSFTGIKYHCISGRRPDKLVYDRKRALFAAESHAEHFLQARLEQSLRLAGAMNEPPVLVAPYDAELFGHWWYEGPEFLDLFVRKAAAVPQAIKLLTPTDYLREHPTHAVVMPDASSWGEGGHLQVWLNEKNASLYPPLRAAQGRMSELVRRHGQAKGVEKRLLQQAARELLLAQSSDWPFILSTGTSPAYARQRFTGHIARFQTLSDQLASGQTDEPRLLAIERQDNLFPQIDCRYWL
jgi:1,4-alpha-glucan branching enzyme